MNATQKLATWALALQYTTIPPPAIDAATKSIYNWAGCAIGGFHQSAPLIAQHTAATLWSGPSTNSGSSILASNTTDLYSPYTAALVNGIASHIDDYDDTHLETIIHPAGPVASALLAITQSALPGRTVNGSEFLTAFVAGVEAECKLGLSVYPEHYDVGWHITSTTGSVGAAVAVCKVLDCDESQMRQAIGIASTQVIGMQEFFGSDTKSFHIGRAAQAGMLAATLTKNGYTSSLEALEAKYGWSHVVSTRENLTETFATLGKTWEVSKNTFKPFPCGIVIHPTIDACIRLHQEALRRGLSISGIKKVDARVNPYVLTLTGKRDPQTGLEAKFSVYHAAAVGLLFGEATPTQFTDEVVLNQTVIALRDKVLTTVDESVPRDEVYLSASFADGTNLTQHVEHAIGSLENPLSDQQLKDKFMQQVEIVLGVERARQADMSFRGIGNLSNVGQVTMPFSMAAMNGNGSGTGSGGDIAGIATRGASRVSSAVAVAFASIVVTLVL